METFREKKLAAFEAAERARRKGQLAAVVGVGMLATAASAGEAWLVAGGVLALAATLHWFVQARRALPRSSAETARSH